jgi:hypothetical protein
MVVVDMEVVGQEVGKLGDASDVAQANIQEMPAPAQQQSNNSAFRPAPSSAGAPGQLAPKKEVSYVPKHILQQQQQQQQQMSLTGGQANVNPIMSLNPYQNK